jgi:hypothetical protein
MAWQPSPYSDPYVGQALSELAKIFAPPSPQEMLAYGQLGEIEDKRAALNDAAAGLGRFLTPEVADLARTGEFDALAPLDLYIRSLSSGGDLHALDPSVYAVHGNAGTTAWGVDQKNQTDLAGHYIDAQSALDVQALENEGTRDRLLISPISIPENGSVRLTGPLADLYGTDTLMGNVSPAENEIVYGANGTQYGGLINVGRDETTFGPDGTMYSGPASPLSKEQVLGAIIAGLPPEQRNMLAMADVPNDVTVNPDGTYTYTPRPAAAGMTAPIPASDTVEVQGAGGSTITTAATAAAGGMAPTADPMSRDEVIAEYLQAHPEVLAQVVMGDVPLETIYDEALKTNVLVPRPQAAGMTAPMAASETVQVQGADGSVIMPAASAASGGMTAAGDPAPPPGPEGTGPEAWAWRVSLDPNATPDEIDRARQILTTPKWVQGVDENGAQVWKLVTPPAPNFAAEGAPSTTGSVAGPPSGLPGGATTSGGFSVTSVPGTETPHRMTEAEAKANNYASRMAEADAGLRAMAEAGFNAPTWATTQFHGQMPDMANLLIDDQSRQWFTLVEQFLNPILRGDSGAAVPESEYPRYYAQFIPKAGDDAGTLALKARAREIAIEAMRAAAGGTYGSVQERDRAVAAAALTAGLRVGDLSGDGGPPPVGAPTAAPATDSAITVESVMQMSVEQLQALGAGDISKLSPDVLQAAADRWNQLTGGQ